MYGERPWFTRKNFVNKSVWKDAVVVTHLEGQRSVSGEEGQRSECTDSACTEGTELETQMQRWHEQDGGQGSWTTLRGTNAQDARRQESQSRCPIMTGQARAATQTVEQLHCQERQSWELGRLGMTGSTSKTYIARSGDKHGCVPKEGNQSSGHHQKLLALVLLPVLALPDGVEDGTC